MQDRFICPEGVSGRADKVLADYYQDFSRAFIKQSIEQREITYADGSVLVPKSKIHPGDVLLVSLVRPKIEELIPYNYNLSVLYEDEHLLVIDKEPGMVVHPGDGTDGKTLVHALLHHCGSNLSPIGAPLRPGIVHRLDKETSGVMVVAKSELAHLSLLDQFASRKTAKIYQAIVCRKLEGRGEYKQPIGRHPTVRVKMAVSEKGKPAWTKWKSLRVMGDQFSYIECEIMTGRTHQIRVHLSSAGHPLAGDKTYGYKANKSDEPISRVMLHACKLSFEHPETSQKLEFSAPLPTDFQQCLKRLEE
jgi:23S rRNA pseudouridine1911/1915/1917 synthase